jgi:hypothetical protein
MDTQNAVEFNIPSIEVPQPIASTRSAYMCGRAARFSGQDTLTVPGMHPSKRRLPSESVAHVSDFYCLLTSVLFIRAERALREIQYELDTAYYSKLRYTACELADRGIFLHHPVGDPQATGAYPSGAHLNRETAVGPLNRRWRWEGRGRVPRIKISRPDDGNATVIPPSDQGSAAPPSHAPARRTRARSNAIRIGSTSRRPSVEVIDAPVQPTIVPVREASRTESIPAPILVSALPPKLPAAQLARKMRGRPSSMSEWLTQFSTGISPLVDAYIVASAGPVVEKALRSAPLSSQPCSPASSPPPSPVFSESSLTLSSPSSSPDSSPPTTPLDDSIPLPPLPTLGEDESKQPANGRRRARCSYDGAKCDLVIAPTIPEELVTEEVGVAC